GSAPVSGSNTSAIAPLPRRGMGKASEANRQRGAAVGTSRSAENSVACRRGGWNQASAPLRRSDLTGASKRARNRGIDAAMLTAPVGVDRLVEADVRAVVLGDDLPGLLDLQLGLQPGRIVVLAVPAVIEVVPGEGLEPPRVVGLGPAALGTVRREARLGHARSIALDRNITRTLGDGSMGTLGNARHRV